VTCRDAMRCDAAVTVRGGGLTAGKAVVAGVNRRRQHKSEQGDEAAGKVNLDNTLEMLERIATGSQVDLGEVVTMRRRLLSGACATP